MEQITNLKDIIDAHTLDLLRDIEQQIQQHQESIADPNLYSQESNCFYAVYTYLRVTKQIPQEYTSDKLIQKLMNIPKRAVKSQASQNETFPKVFVLHHKHTIYHVGIVVGWLDENTPILWSKLGANEFSLDTPESIKDKYKRFEKPFRHIRVSFVKPEYIQQI